MLVDPLGRPGECDRRVFRLEVGKIARIMHFRVDDFVRFAPGNLGSRKEQAERKVGRYIDRSPCSCTA